MSEVKASPCDTSTLLPLTTIRPQRDVKLSEIACTAVAKMQAAIKNKAAAGAPLIVTDDFGPAYAEAIAERARELCPGFEVKTKLMSSGYVRVTISEPTAHKQD